MTETLREVAPKLWVSDIGSAGVVGEDFSLVIDCTGGQGPTNGNGRTVPVRPTGRTNHAWSEADLNTIVGVVTMRLEAGGNVLIHCNRGVSRSACAAAAVLLWTEQAESLAGALDKVAVEGRRPNNHSVGGLRLWWEAQEAAIQPELF